MRRWAGFLLVAVLACQDPHEGRKEAALRDNLNTMRKAIDNFRQDKGRHPRSLDELVPRYIRRIPTDPFTESATTWKITTEETVRPSDDFSTSSTAKSETAIIDIHSGAPGTDASGTRYADY